MKLAESMSFEVFKSDRGFFLAFPYGSPALDADTLTLSVPERRLFAFKGGVELPVSFPRLSVDVAELLSGHDRVIAVAVVLGGIAAGIEVPLTVNH